VDEHASERQIVIRFEAGRDGELATQQIDSLYRRLQQDWLKDAPGTRSVLRTSTDIHHKAGDPFEIFLAIATGVATGMTQQAVPLLIQSIKSWRQSQREEGKKPPAVSVIEDDRVLAQVDDGEPRQIGEA
jgi:hypothetical protein